MMSPEERHVMKNIARSLETIAKIFETMNANLVMLGRDLVPPKVEHNDSDSYKIVNGAGKTVLKRFVPDDQGRMCPSEWRHNLGVNNIRVMNPDSPALAMNENRMMTREQFDEYNDAVYSARVIMNEEDARGIPDSRGRLKPCEWRERFGTPVFDPEETGHEFDENRVMTEEDFRIYNAGLTASGVVQNEDGSTTYTNHPEDLG